MRARSAGFTLVEMIIVIVLTGIIAGIVAAFVSGPVLGYTQTARRAELVDAAELALRRMARDIRQALPNSLRIAQAGAVIEMINVVDAGRYRDDPPPGTAGAILDFTAQDTAFDVIGTLQNFPAIDADATTIDNDQVVIYNLTATGTAGNAYRGDNRARLNAGTTAAHVELVAPGTQFPLASPRQRFYVVDTPVTYLCNTGAGTQSLTRYYRYNFTHPQTAVDTPAELLAAGATAALMTGHVSQCNFTYQPGTSQRAGLVTLRLQLTDQGENVVLLHQVHVYNTP